MLTSSDQFLLSFHKCLLIQQNSITISRLPYLSIVSSLISFVPLPFGDDKFRCVTYRSVKQMNETKLLYGRR